MRISDWSSAVCSSDLELPARHVLPAGQPPILRAPIGPAPLKPGDAAQRPAMTYVVTEACITCKYMDCVEVCPVDCFYEGEHLLVIHPDECIDGGVCEPAFPPEAQVRDTEPQADTMTALHRETSHKTRRNKPQ